MPNSKGSKNSRKPQHFRTRKYSLLSNDIKAQILIDLESGQFATDAPPSEIIESKKSLYGDPSKKEDAQRVRAVTDKIRRYRERKRNDPKEYWYVQTVCSVVYFFVLCSHLLILQSSRRLYAIAIQSPSDSNGLTSDSEYEEDEEVIPELASSSQIKSPRPSIAKPIKSSVAAAAATSLNRKKKAEPLPSKLFKMTDYNPSE